MKLSDFVIDFLAKRGAEHSFLVTGGAILHLADSAGRHPSMQHVCPQHEEFCAAAADGYFRASGRLGLAMTTSGPGATNLLTSVCNAYFDSVPMLCITGQVARFRIRPNKQLRQKGFQETDVCSVFKDVTKYVQLVTDPQMIRYELEKALYTAQEGRPGPVVLDIPDDLQREEVDPENLLSFTPPKECDALPEAEVESLFQMIENAKRPVLIMGQGIHSACEEKRAVEFARYFGLPILLTWGGMDLLPFEDPLNMGGVGIVGPRAGNFAVQTADLVIAMGTRLSPMITGGKQDLFAPRAKKVMIDVDQAELDKFGPSTFTLDLPILSSLQRFFKACEKRYIEGSDHYSDWRKKIQGWRAKYPICPKDYYDLKERVNPYVFIKELSKRAKEDAIIVNDTGATICWICQAFETKAKQRIFSAWNHTPMGYALSAGIGAALGSGKEVICLIGDGGFMMCLQELATLQRYNLPVKVFVFDNQGHATVKQTIDFWLKSNYVAVDVPSGLSFPNYEKLAEAFEIPFHCLEDHEAIAENLTTIYHQPGPLLCQVKVLETQKIVPMLKYGGGLQDLDPRLPQEEIDAIIKEIDLVEV
ncbi:MAG: Acetolactate synthase large subunit [Chlamydiales bacterium]|nr:Acetolactate synthase large subunit [Chlamydiales bacterium]MCH9619494.1 Acetolactate synthase large subunit [Chlamydiales bacterium]MCH9622298.1 Acetolactate synthase large subunit [Chlamydiales bacterium]